MAHTNTINSTRLETLTNDNYDTWVIQVEALLVKNDNWCYVSDQRPYPTGATNDAAVQASIKAWEREDRKAKSDLILAINPTELKQVRGCTTSKEIWDKLKSIYDKLKSTYSKGPARKATLLKRLTQTKMSEDGNIKEHLAQFFDAVDKLESMDVQINGDLLSIMLLYSLPSSLENFRYAIESRNALPNAEQLKIKIVEEYEARNQTATANDSGVLLAHHNKHKPNTRSSKDSSTPRNETKASSRLRLKYSFCKIAGHKYVDCRKRKKQEAEKANNTEVESLFAEVAHYSSSNPPEDSIQWCLDSGCTSHLCKDFRMISNPMRMQSDIKLASSATSSVNAIGNVELLTRVNKTDRRIRLENALHVPDLRTNLLSVVKIVHKVTFDAKQASVRDQHGNVKLIIEREGDLYILNASAQQVNFVAQTKRSDAQIWHERLGHLNWKDLLSMSKSGAVSGLQIKDHTNITDCEVCITQKLTSLSFPPRVRRSQHLLEIIYSDLCGPMRVNSIGGAIHDPHR